jgi:hypothetical protein
MYYEVQVNGETIIPILNDAALAKSQSIPRAWYAVRVGHSDCRGFTRWNRCVHEMALRRYLGVDEPAPGYAAWLERRHVLANG